jgi:hypothetical protein
VGWGGVGLDLVLIMNDLPMTWWFKVPSDRSDRAVAPYVQYYTSNVDCRIGRAGHF